jgi:glycerophosphoryl diester phosphodiesterase
VAHALRLYAHRGASAELPENTMAAFRRALEIGVDALETDVHMTRDGHVVVSHDADGLRRAGVARPIRAVTLEELRGWDVGDGHRMPTLEEVLVAFPEVPFNIDIKQAEPSMVRPLLRLLERLGAEERVTLAAFHMRTLLTVRALGYRGPTSLPKAEVLTMLYAPTSLFRLVPLRGQAAQLPVSAGRMRFDTTDVVARCHRLGLRLDYWTVNDPAEAERLLDLGADGIMTDDPRAIAPVFAERRARRV